LLDVIVIGTLVLFMYLGYRRGLLNMVYSLGSFVLAIFLAIYLFPIVAEWLMTTPVYTALKDYIIRTMGLEDMIYGTATEFIAGLPLPDMISRYLLRNSTPEMFERLNVSSIEQFVAAYFARMAINIIALVLVFILVRLLLGFISKLFDLVGRLPVIKHFNRGGGLLFGLVQGLLIVWIGLAIMILFFLDPTGPELRQMLDDSLIVGWIYEHNPIMAILANIR